jgi:hypothetical protein
MALFAVEIEGFAVASFREPRHTASLAAGCEGGLRLLLPRAGVFCAHFPGIGCNWTEVHKGKDF